MPGASAAAIHPEGRARARAGCGSVVARSIGGCTVLASARADSPLRLLEPQKRPGTSSASVCVVTFGGGLVDGDAIDLDLVVEPNATLVVFTQSTTKVFRGSSRQTLSAKVDGTLVLLPDPVSAFAHARYEQRVEVTLGAAGACVLLDGFTSGRAAFGERWAMTSLDLRTRVTLSSDHPAEASGHVLVTDALRLDVADGSIAERAGRFDAFATLVAAGHAAAPIVHAIQRAPVGPPTADLVVAASPLPRAKDLLPGAIARIAASSPARALAAVRARLRNLADIDVVDPFASRY